MASLKEIARLCNTSISTVSRVLNDPGHQCHNKELAENIHGTARKMGYLPNPAARELKLKNTPSPTPVTVDILFARFRSLDNDYFFKELFESIQNALFQKGFLLGELKNVPDIQKILKTSPKKLYGQQKKKGLIILGKCPKELIASLHNLYRYMVAVDRNPTDYELDEIVCDGKYAAILAMKHLVSLGHKKIAYIGDCSYEARYIGYYEALLNAGIPIDYQFIFATKQTREEGEKTVSSILAMENRPTAIFCANDTTAIGVLKELSRHKRSKYVPSVISIDNIRQSETCSPMLTTVDIPKEEMGSLAVTILNDRINGGHEKHLRVSLPCSLILRESCSYYGGN